MQNMWRVIILFLFATQIAFGETVSVTTWNLEWFPSGSPKNAAPEVEAKKIRDVAEILKGLNSDVLILQEVRNLAVCKTLIEELKPLNYQVAICSQFKESFSGVAGLQQVAILSKKPAFAAWFEAWKTTSGVDPARGFAFAAIRWGTNDVGFYGVHLKSNLTRGGSERDQQLNILKRELAAEQFIRHIKHVGTVLTNELESVVIAGDFNTNPDQAEFVSERTLTLLGEEGFTSGFEGLPLSERITHPGNGRYPDCTFDYVFTQSVKSREKPRITPTGLSDHLPVTVVLKF